ncbi:MAG: DUF4190 domain-containing protein [Armatimonadota bacterium]
MSIQSPKPMRTGEYPSSRSILALIFGILGLISIGLFAIPAWILGKEEREAIQRGESPEAGRAMADAGYILGIIGIVVLVVIVAVWILVGLFLVVAIR